MKNVDMTVEGTKLTITIDLTKTFGPSVSARPSSLRQRKKM